MLSFYKQGKICFFTFNPDMHVEHVTNCWIPRTLLCSPYHATLSKYKADNLIEIRCMEPVDFINKIASLPLSCSSHCNLQVMKTCSECANCSPLLSPLQRKIHTYPTSAISLFLATCSGWTTSSFHAGLRHDHLVSRLNALLLPLKNKYLKKELELTRHGNNEQAMARIFRYRTGNSNA